MYIYVCMVNRNRKATIIQKFVRLYILHKRVDFDALWITSLGRSRKSIIGLEYQRSANILIQVLQAYQSMPFPTYSVICERKKYVYIHIFAYYLYIYMYIYYIIVVFILLFK